jgi:UDP-glucose 4-epimerase
MQIITGVAGFIGSNLAHHFLDAGETVLGVDNFLLGTSQNIADLRRYSDFQFSEFDVTDRVKMTAFLNSISNEERGGAVVWHMAANSDISAGILDVNVDYKNTLDSTVSVLQAMKDTGLDKLMFASSSAIYGDRDGLPMAENEGPYLPISNYGAMKLASEAVISAATESHLARAMIYRFPNVVGERLTHGVIYDFAKKLSRNSGNLGVLGDGSQCKPYLYVGDLIAAMLSASEAERSEKINIYNIAADGEGTSVKEIAELMVQMNPRKAKIQYGSGNKGWVGDVSKVSYDLTKIKEIGWISQFSSLEAVSLAAQWAVKNVR